jgi:hypothetical protein
MGLSDDMSEHVVRASNYVINDWNGEENADENDEYVLRHENFFTVEDLGFQKHKTLKGWGKDVQ